MPQTAFSSVPQIVYTLTTTPAVVSALTVADQTFTVPGLRTGMNVVVNARALDANLMIGNAFCSAANTLTIRFMNPTAGDITPVSQSFYILGL